MSESEVLHQADERMAEEKDRRDARIRFGTSGLCLGFALLVAAAVAVAVAAAPAAAVAARPNVLILLADDLGYRDVGCYDGPVQTPNIDALAAAGTRFEQFYSGCAVCSPSRATLMTGRHHIRTGVYSWIHDASQKSHLRLRETTLAEVLKAEGYATAHVGKWHLGLPPAMAKEGEAGDRGYQKPTPDQHGFDHWFATGNNASPSHHNPKNFIRNGEPVGQLEGYSCQLVVDEAIDWLESSEGDEPFFLNVWFHEPHAPIAAPDSIVRQYGETDERSAIYSGTIDNTDQAIGRLVEFLRTRDQLDDTLIVYASDNGSYLNERTGQLRGQKGVNWEGGIRVPGIFRWPGVVESGKVCQTPAGLVDVLPTLCGLLKISPPAVHLDGSDLTPLLSGQPEQFQRHQPLFWHLQKSRPIVAMRDGDFSLVADPDYELSTRNMFQESWIPKIRAGGYRNFRLYDLAEDPGQTTDVSADHPEVLGRMKSDLRRINASIMSDATDWTTF